MKLSISDKSRLKNQYGEWAVVTGASSGIGLALAECLADAGFINQHTTKNRSDKPLRYAKNIVLLP